MSFYGSSFSFDGTSCEEYGLMLYNFSSNEQGPSEFAPINISEDRIRGKYKSLFYEDDYKQPLEFTLVFGADEYTAYRGESIDRQEMEIIASWLLNKGGYKWLVIDQPDMDGIRYNCIITSLKTIEFAGHKWAFSCTVHCDSPYAYTTPERFAYTVNGTKSFVLRSRSTANIKYFPTVHIDLTNGTTFTITNNTTGEITSLSNIPGGTRSITMNGETGVVSADSGLNMYAGFNFVFPSLIRGENEFTVSGNGALTFECEFPVNIGG